MTHLAMGGTEKSRSAETTYLGAFFSKRSLTKIDMTAYAASGPQIDSASISGDLPSQ